MVLTNIRILAHGGDVGLILSVYRCEIGAIFTPQLSREHTGFDWIFFVEAARLLENQYPKTFLEKAELLSRGASLHNRSL